MKRDNLAHAIAADPLSPSHAASALSSAGYVMTGACAKKVGIRAPGRLHLGFLDPSASLGRQFGSIGLIVDGPVTELRMGLCEGNLDHLHARPLAEHELSRVRSYLARLREQTGLVAPMEVHLATVLPAHAGLGSGTQLALAVGRAFASVHGLQVSTTQLAQWLGRGLRSGVGIAGFDHGGFIVDGGPAPSRSLHATDPAPVLAQLMFPDEWRVLVVLDPRMEGLHGEAEREALRTLAPFPQALAAQLCHEVLMRVLPALHEHDFPAFAAGIGTIQRTIATYFAPAQGGAFSSHAVGQFLEWIGTNITTGVGQSSWGPTGFAFFSSQASAEAALAAARAAGVVDAQLEVGIHQALNHGALCQDVAQS